MRTVEVFLNASLSARGGGFCVGDVLVGCGRYVRFRFERPGGGHDLEVLERAFEIGRDDAGRPYLPQSVGDVMRVDGFCCYAVDRVGYTTVQGLPGTVVWGADQLVGHGLAADDLTDRQRLAGEMRAQGGL